MKLLILSLVFLCTACGCVGAATKDAGPPVHPIDVSGFDAGAPATYPGY